MGIQLALVLTVFLFPHRASGKQGKTGPKNVQLLTGLSDLPLQRTMNFMRASLGVHCDYCHVFDNEWHFDKDDKATKLVARKMIQLTADINTQYFNSKPVVSCYTCHQGHITTVGTPTFPVAVPDFPTVVPAQNDPGPLPSVADVLDHYETALGGRTAIDRMRSRSLKGSVQMWDHEPHPIEISQVAPDKYLSIMTTGQGRNFRGYDGSTGWARSAESVRKLGGGALSELVRIADIYKDMRIKERRPGLKVIGKEKIGDKDCYVLEAPVSQNTTEKLFFDTATGLLKRRLTLMETKVGVVPERFDFDDYRDVDGVREPFSVDMYYVDPWVSQIRQYTEIKHNVALDDSIFVPGAPRN
jgi:hypothetical protein